MTQLTLNIEDNATVKIIKKILKAFDGVTIINQAKPHKSGIEEAYDDVRAGRITRYNSAQDFYDAFGI